MTCDERRDLMLLYAAGALDDAERRELDAHLSVGCPACAGALAEAQATVAHLPLALNPVAPPAAARDQLMQRALADASGARAPGTAAPAPRRSLAPWLVLATAAAIAFAIGGFFTNNLAQRYKDRMVQAQADAGRARASIKQIETELAKYQNENEQLRAVAALLNSSNLDLVKLASQETPARGRIFWDRDHNRWHVQVFDLKPPPPGREFELWFITPEKRTIPAGTFRVDATGRGTHEVDVPRDIGPIAMAAITDEPIGGVPEPTGSIHLAGAVQ